MHSGRDIYCMRNALLRCSSVATNVCMRRDLNSRWRDMAHWPPESGALAHGLAYESKIIPKKIDTQKVYPCFVCAWYTAFSGVSSRAPLLARALCMARFFRTPHRSLGPPHNSTPLSRIGKMSEALDSATPK